MRRFRLAWFALAALFAGAAAPAPADAKVLIEIDKSTQQMTVSVDGATRWVWPVSTGRRGRETPNGTYQAFRLEEDHYSREWDDAPMPHSVFFTKRGHAIHGSYDIKRLGTAASAGCVRLHPDNAKQLFALVKAQGVLNATVIISGVEPPAAPPPAVARQTPQPYQAAPQAAPLQPRVARQPRYEQYYEYEPPRRPQYGAPVYRQPQGYYQQQLPPPPPGYYYANPPAPRGYHYYYR
jgi:L,D-transpeptidase catalytic domain